MKEPGIPFAVSSGSVRVFGVDLIVHHLSNGKRVIEEGSMVALFEAMSNPNAPKDDIDMDALRILIRGS